MQKDGHMDTTISGEEWRPVPGYDGRYEASSYGRLRRVKGRGASPISPRLLNAQSNNGYLRVVVQRDGKRYSPGAHILVAAAFWGECPPGLEVNHKDADRANNRPENLEYVTHYQNVQARRPYTRYVKPRRLTEEQVADIKSSPLTQRKLGEIYGVSGVAICRIRKGSLYK